MPDSLLARAVRPEGTISLVATVTELAPEVDESGNTFTPQRITALALTFSDPGLLYSARIVATRIDGVAFDATISRTSTSDQLSVSRTFNGNARWRMDSDWSFRMAVF